MKIDQKSIDKYQMNGVVLLKNIISLEWIEKLKKGIIENFKNPSKYKCVYEKNDNIELFYDDYCNWNRINEYKDFLFNSNLPSIASQLMISKKVNLFHEHVLIKEKGSRKKTPWHQDQSYYCVNGKQNISFWCPLDIIKKIHVQNIFQNHINGLNSFYQLNFLVIVMISLIVNLKRYLI